MIPRANRRHPKENRKLHRIFVGNAEAFHAEIILDEQPIPCLVTDFHSAGLGLRVPGDLLFERGQVIPEIYLYYGRKKIGVFPQTKIASAGPNGKIGVELKNTSSIRGVRRNNNRLRVDPHFKASVLLRDPLRMSEMLHFNLVNLNAEGILLETSFSNKHIVAGMQLDQLKILLPGLRIIELSGKVTRIEVGSDKLLIGLVFTFIKPDSLEALTQFCLFGTVGEEKNLPKTLELIKGANFKLKKVGPAVKIALVSTREDYAATLQVRHVAYKTAAKLNDTATVDDMADEYDLRSIILNAKFRNFTVATVRLVESDDEREPFPFENSLKFSEVLSDKKRTDVFEISRLAILPELQGTDILVRLFQECSKQVLIKKNTAVCLATRATRKNYELLGWRKCSKEVPHPVLTDDTLALLRVDRKTFLQGRWVNATAWKRVIQIMADHLSHYSIIDNPQFNPRIAVMGRVEAFVLKMRGPKKKKP